ncbi:SpaA isopeptide-forming pilin-related protein [Corynebacterium amycolatum]|uniref:SpaA isopeptide-forming pilin-related protein n=1 Tax=Corynebacterium amycolatum TaxID=43765 RepID=UPI000185C07D|nr:SpaA isopeptide-forming pilin-related protein [Corynebacterium amycolatum]EEB62471.1 LPXTG-motif cell wall anchor domain protein [Corynebacterium amycolatum SK46]
MNKYLTSTWNRIAAFLAACALVAVMGAIGANDANAARIVGRVDAPGVSATSGTDIVRITLSPGNPDDDNSSASGSISGVTIHLERLKGISPSSPQDREKVENATAAELAEWPKDLHFSQVTDENGSVKFSDLPEGIYLVTSTAPNDSYREINSFLVSVPFYGAGYDSTPVEGVIVAKSHKPGETPPPSTPPTTPPKTPPTTPPGTPPTTPGTSTPPKTPPTTPTTPTTPGKPGTSTTTSTTSTTPGEPGTSTPSDSSGSSSSSGSSGRSGSLALTGVQVAGLVAVAAALIGGGFVIIAASKKNSESGKN